jgi:hypothetical protein
MSIDFNVNHISYRFYGDKLISTDQCNNLIIESSTNNIEFKANNQNITLNNNSVFNYGLTLNDGDLSNIQNITGKTLNIDTLFVTDISNSQATIDDYNSINYGYIRGTTIGYDPSNLNDISGRSDAYFTYINVSGGDSSFNNSLYIKNTLGVTGATTISNDLIVNGKSYVTLYNTINNYISNIRQDFSSVRILTNDLSATNISISNELVVNNISFFNDLSINGQLLNTILKVPHDFTIDPSGHDNNSGTLIINGDLIVYGNRTTIASNIIEISDITLSVAVNLLNINDLYRNNAGLDISNVASIKYDGTAWNFTGGQLTVENKKTVLDASLIALKNITEVSLNILNSYFDLSYSQLKKNMDDSFNVTYTQNQIDNSFILKSNFDISLLSFKNYLDNSYVGALQFDASFSALRTILDASYILNSTPINLNTIDSSLIFLRSKLDLSYVLKSDFEVSYNDLKSKIETSFNSIKLTSLDTSSISVDTINTKHYSQRFNNILWNQIGLDISNTNPVNNKKIAISNDGKVIAMSSSTFDLSNATDVGIVYVYEINYNEISYNWIRLGSNNIVGISGDELGYSLALSSNGRIVAASSLNNDISGTNSGQVRVYELSNNIWTLLGNPINGRNITNYQSGHTLNLSGNGKIISISSLKGIIDPSYNYGEVKVYELSSNNIWIQKGRDISRSDVNTLYTNMASLGTGGTTRTIVGNYVIHSFLTVGSFSFTPATSGLVEVLLVGGGGGGGREIGGGGGGGGVIWIPSLMVSAGTSYPIVVGAGGASGTSGGNSSAFGTIAAGGGSSGRYDNGLGTPGGSGGGAAANNSILNQGGISNGNSVGTISNAIAYGNRGGYMTTARTGGPTRAAGGGGAGGQALDTNSNLTGNTGQNGAGSGGVGIVNAILGTSYYWGGGGGGGSYGSQVGGWGGLGGGGGGSSEDSAGGTGGASALNNGFPGGTGPTIVGGNGGNNTGGGGGGGAALAAGGAGGSGIVVIRYLRYADIGVNSTSLSLDGNTLAIGCDISSNNNTGQVNIFRFTNNWNLIGSIQGPDISNLYFGRAIKLSENGNVIVIGAPGYNIPPVTNSTSSSSFAISTISTTRDEHITIAATVPGRTLGSILNVTEKETVRLIMQANTSDVYIGARRRATSTNATGRTSIDWEWVSGDIWDYQNFQPGDPNNLSNRALIMWGWGGAGDWYNATGNSVMRAIYKTTTITTTTITNSIPNVGQAYVYSYVGGTTWTQIGQAIQGISGGDEFGSSVSISNDGSIISVGSDNNSSNRGHVRVFLYANNYWNQVSNTLSGKTASSKAGIHALNGDGTTLIQTNNTYNSVYGINKTLVLNAPTTTISGNLIVLGNISANSLDISLNHSYSSNGYSYKIFESSLSSAIMKEYYSDVTSTRNLKVQITGNGTITNRTNSYKAISDSRLKENIQDTGPKLEELLKVRVVDYTMKGSNNTKYIGVLAQELEELFPNLVTELEPSPKDIEDGITIKYKAVNYSSFDVILIKSLQEQNAILNNITKRIEALEEKLEIE